MNESQISNLSIQNWPKLTNDELIKFYDEIKSNKILDLNWTNPGRNDPNFVEAKQVANESDDAKESSFTKNDKMDFLISGPSETNQSTELDYKFDLFDEFNNDMEKNSNQVLRLTHSKIPRDSDKKVASMDKILDDIRKKYEIEHKSQINPGKSSAEFMLLVNDNFMMEETGTENDKTDM